jgi:hypothetical protein
MMGMLVPSPAGRVHVMVVCAKPVRAAQRALAGAGRDAEVQPVPTGLHAAGTPPTTKNTEPEVPKFVPESTTLVPPPDTPARAVKPRHGDSGAGITGVGRDGRQRGRREAEGARGGGAAQHADHDLLVRALPGCPRIRVSLRAFALRARHARGTVQTSWVCVRVVTGQATPLSVTDPGARAIKTENNSPCPCLSSQSWCRSQSARSRRQSVPSWGSCR